MKLKPIEEQVVVVMGASSGIGRETAKRFAQRGAKVVAAARNLEGLQSLREEVQRDGGEITTVQADTSQFDQVKKVADHAAEHYGHLDTWAQVAGVLMLAPFEETTPEEFAQVVQINLLGQAYGAMAALPHLKREGRGALIHVSSIEARRGFPLSSAYSASKHGIKGLLEALRVELAKEHANISVTEIIPTTINTPLFNHARTKIGVKPNAPPPRYQPNIVANAILYAAEHSVPEIIAGGWGASLIQTEKLAPGLLDAFMVGPGMQLQKTDEPKSPDAPNNLYGPIQGYDRAQGDFGRFAMSFDPYTWLQRHRVLRGVGMAGLALGTMTLIATRTMSTTGRVKFAWNLVKLARKF